MIRLHDLFTDHIVLQREKRVPVWGTGPDGAAVTVQCGAIRAETVVSDGKWRVDLPPSEAGGPYELTVTGAKETVVLRDVWFGEVWLAGGQSNMEWRLPDTNEGPEEIPQALDAGIRYYDVPRIAVKDGVERHPSWLVCSPETAPQFSAVAYFFAKRIREELKVRVGIIGCNWGATSASCWVGEEILSEDPELRVYLDEFAAEMKDFTWEAYEEQNREFQRGVDAFLERQARGLTGPELGDHPWPPPSSPHSWMRPNGLYGTMLTKAIPYALRGFLYYQGESDVDKAHLYDRLLGKLIGQWRSDWEDQDLPFLFVQLPVYAYNGAPDGEQWPLLREAQWKVSNRVPNAFMAMAWEYGDLNDIHPRDKRPVGERLAQLALEHVYGRTEVESAGPEFEGDVKFEDGSAIVRFSHSGSGLCIRGEGELIGFELAGRDGLFVKAKAVISGDSVLVCSNRIADPSALRYGWANYSKANLVNSIGLPALPFRTTSGQ